MIKNADAEGPCYPVFHICMNIANITMQEVCCAAPASNNALTQRLRRESKMKISVGSYLELYFV